MLGLDGHGGPIRAGRAANIVVFDPAAEWTVEPASFLSKSRNTPFGGRRMRARVIHNFFNGRRTVVDGKVVSEVLV